MHTRAQWKESVKLGTRRALLKCDLDIGRDPASGRLSRTLRSRGIDTILDVGANVGQFAAITRSAGFGGRIHSFEPMPDAFARLALRAGRDQMWTAHNKAVGSEPGALRLNIAANSFSSSVLDMEPAHLEAAPESAYISQINVETTTVAHVLAATDTDPASTLLKVDTQGYEKPVLEGAGTHLAEFAALQLEMSFVPLYDGQVLFDDLRAYVESAGFELFSLQPGIAAKDGRLLQADGLFVRTI